MNFDKLDMLFLHPPASVYNVSHTLDADVNYTNQFVAIPIGIFSMAANLDKANYNVGILNLGERVYANPDMTLHQHIEYILSTYRPKVIGLDIQWVIHSLGAIECAKIIKGYSSDIYVVLGGISASFYAHEILKKYPYIDYVMVGECDESIVDLLREITNLNFDLGKVPNLTYRNGKTVIMNQVSVPNISREIDLTRYDLLIEKPVINHDRAIISFLRGCYKSCFFCAGGKQSFEHIMKRNKIGIIDPDVLVELMKKNIINGKNKIYLYGDIRLCGSEYIDKFFKHLYASEINRAHVVFEFFTLGTEEYVQRWSTWAKETGNSIEATHSPESGNMKIRKQLGKGYSNERLLAHCQLLVEYNIPQSIYFLLGLPKQTIETIEETLILSDRIVEIFTKRFTRSHLRHEVVSFNFMQMPDVGSEVFRDPERFGYHLDYNNFESFIENYRYARHWSETVGYHTDTLSKKELIEQYYHIQKSILKIYHSHHMISDKEFREGVDKYINDEQKIRSQIPPNIKSGLLPLKFKTVNKLEKKYFLISLN